MSELYQAVGILKKRLSAKQSKEAVDPQDRQAYKSAIDAAAELCHKRFGDWGSKAGGFPSHGPDHAGRVLSFALQMSGLLARKNPLKADELYTLGIAAILHDVGMTAPLPAEECESCPTKHEQWVRRRLRHARATAEMIRQCGDDLLHTVRHANQDIYNTFLPDICEAHSTIEFGRCLEALKAKAHLAERKRYRTIAGILLLSDEFDVSRRRAEPDEDRYKEFQCSTTKAHWWKHWLVRIAVLEGNVFRVVHVGSSAYPEAKVFAEWTKEKLWNQIRLVQEELDPDYTSPLWCISPSLTMDNKIDPPHGVPALTNEVVEAAASERARVSTTQAQPILHPTRIIYGVRRRDEHGNPSEFFRSAIAPRIKHFRGQGQHLPLDKAQSIYVKCRSNMALMDDAINELVQYVKGPKAGVNMRVFVGEIGVGKTHFLSVFLHRISKEHADVWNSAIFARAELTHCPNDMRHIKNRVAQAVYSELRRLNLVKPIREAMLRHYEDTSPQVPATDTEIEDWPDGKAEGLLRTIGSISRGGDLSRHLGVEPPRALCIFLDNSDQLEKYLVMDIHAWCLSISGAVGSLLWLFLRPDAYTYLARRHESPPSGYFTLRQPETIVAPPLKEAITRRIEEFPNEFAPGENIEIASAGSAVFSPEDVRDSIAYISSLALETTEDMLPHLANMPEGSEGMRGTNIRAGLEGLIGILGSHLMTDPIYCETLLLRRAVGQTGVAKPAFKRWARVLEALLLGCRKWYRSDCGPIENLLDPPGVQMRGDYFLLIHCLQILRNKVSMELGQLIRAASPMGYDSFRVQDGICHLATRVILDSERRSLYQRSCPLVLIEDEEISATEPPYPESASVTIMPWGEYHLDRLLYQAQYWRHIHYRLILPRNLVSEMESEGLQTDQSALEYNLRKVFVYLRTIEERWLERSANKEIPEIYPVMQKVESQVLKQLGEM